MKQVLLAILLLTALVIAAFLAFSWPSAEASPGATMTVDSTGDTNSRDGVLTLREAMLLATWPLVVVSLDSGECAQVSNSTYGPPCSTTDTVGAASADTIIFDAAVFPPGSPATITVGSKLPTLSTGSDTVSGVGAEVIVDGVSRTSTCFDIGPESSDGNGIKGLQIRGCAAAIWINSGADNNIIGGSTSAERNVISGNTDAILISGSASNGNLVKGNYIGVNAAGDAVLANQGDGVFIWAGAQDNVVGGSSAGERNVISGNSSGVAITGAGTNGNKVSGNHIGTNAAGGAALPNQWSGVEVGGGAQNTTIGGAATGERNVISGNGAHGVRIDGDGTNGNKVSGNYIGTNAAGNAALPNQSSGVSIWAGAQDNTVGGSTAGERNVISGNSWEGVLIQSDGTNGNKVSGNYIGTNAAGDAALGNGTTGVYILWGPQNSTIGGSTAGERNVISGNREDGVVLRDGDYSSVSGNYIGTNAAGDTALPNLWTGVFVYEGSDSNVIGGSTAGERNVISGNSQGGILIGGQGNRVVGNYIGTDAAGHAAVPNQAQGATIWDGANVGGSAQGEGNVIAYNIGDGVQVPGGTGNTIRGNSIHSNGLKGIATVDGGNLELAPPVIDSVGGSVSGHTEPKCYPCTVEVFSDDEDEGRIYHASTSTNDDTTGTWVYTGAVTGPNVTATITDSSGNTSEFSAPVFSGHSDEDGFSDAIEIYLGTDPLDACPDDPTDDAWPLDVNMDTVITVPGDVLNYRGRIGETGGPPPSANWWVRLDFNMDDVITVPGDMLMYRGMIGQTCT